MAKFLLKYPTRARPDLFKSTLRSYLDRLSNKHEYDFLINFDEDDKTMNNPDMIEWIEQQPHCRYVIGKCKTKVEAINYAVPDEGWQILILISDDMICKAKDFDDIIANLFKNYIPDLDGVLHTNDNRARDGLNCLCIFGINYYKRFNYIYHPNYKSLWCDNEFTDVSYKLGKVVYHDEVLIEHKWCVDNKDSLMAHNESFYNEDKAIYDIRKQEGFPHDSAIPAFKSSSEYNRWIKVRQKEIRRSERLKRIDQRRQKR